MLWFVFIYKGRIGMVTAGCVDDITVPYDSLLYHWNGNIICSFDYCSAILSFVNKYGYLPEWIEWK